MLENLDPKDFELNLPQPELEMAFQVVQEAWEESESNLVQLEIPPPLQHLTRYQWESVCHLLSFLMWQQERSPLH